MQINDLSPEESKMQRNVSHVTIQLACTNPREIGLQLQIIARALMVNADLAREKTLCYDYGNGTGHARFTFSEEPC